MRIVIAGQPGTRKAAVSERIVAEVLKRRGISAEHPASKKEIKCYEVEAKDWLGVDFLTFLTNYNEEEQRKHWSSALQRINKDIRQRKPKDAILLIHATCLRNGRFFSALSWNDLLAFRPDCLIVLIDDVYDVWHRIESGPHDTHLSLEQVLTWRSVETLYAETLAANLRLDAEKLNITKVPGSLKHVFGSQLPVFVMAAKHPVETFCDLIFERGHKPIVYASFPITRTRGKKERIADIDSFRSELHDAGAIVIDPLTIDELRIEDIKEWQKLRNIENFRSYQNLRWQLKGATVEAETDFERSPFENLTEGQIIDLRDMILQQVVDRDYRLVGQSGMLIAYRPFYPQVGEAKTGQAPNGSTGGVTREINYALSLGRPVWMFHPRSDYSPQHDANFFDSLSVWARVERFPKKSKMQELPEGDFTGFDELLAKLKKTSGS